MNNKKLNLVFYLVVFLVCSCSKKIYKRDETKIDVDLAESGYFNTKENSYVSPENLTPRDYPRKKGDKIYPYKSPEKKFTVQEYIDIYAPLAIIEMEKYRIPASITMAQGILESGSGNSRLSKKANNHFGIKCHDWEGPTIYHDDDEKGECFRKYRSPISSYRDHSIFLAHRNRYSNLFNLDLEDYIGWAKGLKSAGYATAPDYAEKLISLIERYNLYLLDGTSKKRAIEIRNANNGIIDDNFDMTSKTIDDMKIQDIVSESMQNLSLVHKEESDNLKRDSKEDLDSIEVIDSQNNEVEGILKSIKQQIGSNLEMSQHFNAMNEQKLNDVLISSGISKDISTDKIETVVKSELKKVSDEISKEVNETSEQIEDSMMLNQEDSELNIRKSINSKKVSDEISKEVNETSEQIEDSMMLNQEDSELNIRKSINSNEILKNDDHTINNTTIEVRTKQTLYSLAKEYKTTIDEIKKINNLISDSLQIGQKLKIPQNLEKSVFNVHVDPTNYKVIVVQKKQTLFSIAKDYNTTVEKLKKLNNMSDYKIRAGQELKIPQNLEKLVYDVDIDPSNYKVIIVQKKQTLFSIAKEFNITVEKLKKINNMSNNEIKIGQSLKIPAL